MLKSSSAGYASAAASRSAEIQVIMSPPSLCPSEGFGEKPPIVQV